MQCNTVTSANVHLCVARYLEQASQYGCMKPDFCVLDVKASLCV